MAVEVGKGYVDIVPDLKGFQDKVGREVEQAASKASRRADKAINVGAKLTAGLTVPIVAGLGAAGKAASDLEQSVGAVESVFGDASGTIFEFGETSADSFGLAREEVNRLGAVVGAQLQGLGFEADDAAQETVKLQERAADMAATFGGDVSQSVEAISALLRGERDTIEKYGVSLKQADIDARIMSMGLDTSTTAAEKQATAIASLDLLYEQTADTAGQFNREQDTAAGQAERAQAKFKDAAAALGEELLPIMAQGADVAGDLVSVFSSMPEGVQKGVIALAGIAAAVGPISIAAGGAVKGIQAIKTATTALKTARTASTAANVAEGYSAIGANAASAIPNLRRFAQVARFAGIAGGLILLNDLLGDARTEAARFAEEVAGGFSDPEKQLANVREEIEALNEAAAKGVRADWIPGVTLFSSDEAKQAQNRIDALKDKAAELELQLSLNTDAASENADATEDGTTAIAEQAAVVEQAKQAHQEYTDQLRAAVDPVFALNDAFQGVEDAQAAYTEAVKEHGKESAEAEQAAFDLAAATADLEQAAIDGDLSFEAFDRKLADWVAQGKITATQADTMRGRVRDLRGEAEDYQGEYDAYLEAHTGGASARVAALRQQILDLIRGNYVVTIDQQWGFTVRPPGSTGGAIPAGRAHGGPVSPTETYWVGEQGPELFRPDSAGEIVPHDESMRTTSGIDRALIEELANRPVVVQVDGETIAQVVDRNRDRMALRNGR